MRRGGAIPPPPPKRGISAILARYPMKTRQNVCDCPLCDIISKGYCARWGLLREMGEGISHWAAKDRAPQELFELQARIPGAPPPGAAGDPFLADTPGRAKGSPEERNFSACCLHIVQLAMWGLGVWRAAFAATPTRPSPRKKRNRKGKPRLARILAMNPRHRPRPAERSSRTWSR